MSPDETPEKGGKGFLKIPHRGNLPSGYDLALRWGLTLAISVLVGVLAGRWLDQKLSTTPLFLLVGLFWGVGGSFWSLFLQVKRMNENEAKKSLEEKNSLNK